VDAGTRPFKGYICWKDSRIGEVINKEAASTSRADFLATHAPLGRIRYLRAPQAMADTSEERLLGELLTRGEAGRHTFAVVQGIPGTGKSHLIRWLKERYGAAMEERDGHDVVLLIERANCSLRGTLQQLIASGAFDERTMHNQLEKLRGATAELSKAALADTVLNNLQVATHEVQLHEGETPRPRIRTKVEKFLLDFNVREALKLPGGPVDRLTRFLSEGTLGGVRTDELPGFEAGDFAFDVDILQRVRGEGYAEARELADSLALKPDLREELARYLNHLLNYAVGRTLALSAEDLKDMFGDLRRDLGWRGRSLALFIEDITAFTGVDAGLIDVLATQHTGEGNSQFCRLTTIVGITDAYFADRFPDNMKERVTHQLTLNAVEQGHPVSDLLQDPEMTTDLAARYLNAMRLDGTVLADWAQHGGEQQHLPNACASCAFRAPCHAAFGAIHLAAGGEHAADATRTGDNRAIGLYPFNQSAIWSMYRNLDSPMTSRTPRSLLNSVLEYVLQSHGQSIADGHFPPPPTRVGSDFNAPTLTRQVQRRAIENQAGRDAPRVESLVLFWGDRTIDATRAPDGQQLVGGLVRGVFDAFDVPFIEGVATGMDGTAIRATRAVGTAGPAVAEGAATQAAVADSTSRPAPSASEQSRVFARDIRAWATGDEPLRNHERLREFVATLLQSAIDWEAHGISPFQWRDRIVARRIYVEGQFGRMNVQDYLTLSRSDELAYVLQALADLNDTASQIDPSALGSHLATLANWLRNEEPRIVQYARQPASDSAEARSLLDVLLADCLFMEMLSGTLRLLDHPQDTLHDLIASCAPAAKDSTKAAAEWARDLERAKQVRSQLWVDLMKRLGQSSSSRVQACRATLLKLLNRAQGDSQNVRFVDAAALLDALKRFEDTGWTTPALACNTASAPGWAEGSEVYAVLADNFVQLLADERMNIRGRLSRLDGILGGDPPERALDAIANTLTTLRTSNRHYDMEDKPPRTASAITRHRRSLESAADERERRQSALKLSAAEDDLEALASFIGYLDDFCRLAERVEQQAAGRLAQLDADGTDADSYEAVEREYAEIERLLDGIAAPVAVKEARQ
jgi:hypothetical protein